MQSVYDVLFSLVYSSRNTVVISPCNSGAVHVVVMLQIKRVAVIAKQINRACLLSVCVGGGDGQGGVHAPRRCSSQ